MNDLNMGYVFYVYNNYDLRGGHVFVRGMH